MMSCEGEERGGECGGICKGGDITSISTHVLSLSSLQKGKYSRSLFFKKKTDDG
jgi:hypothetical protein